MEGSQSKEKDDGRGSAEDGPQNHESTNPSSTHPYNKLCYLLEFLFSNPYYPLVFISIGCLTFARDLSFPSKPGFNPWTDWMRDIAQDPVCLVYYGCHKSITAILFGIWERYELLSEHAITIRPPPVVIGSVAIHAAQRRTPDLSTRIWFMCCKILVFIITLFGLYNSLRAPRHYWHDLMLNAKWATAPGTSRAMAPAPLALLCYDAYCLLWACVAIPVMIWTSLMNFAFCFSWVVGPETATWETSTRRWMQRATRLRDRFNWATWAWMGLHTVVYLDTSEPILRVVARVYRKDLRIMEAFFFPGYF